MCAFRSVRYGSVRSVITSVRDGLYGLFVAAGTYETVDPTLARGPRGGASRAARAPRAGTLHGWARSRHRSGSADPTLPLPIRPTPHRRRHIPPGPHKQRHAATRARDSSEISSRSDSSDDRLPDMRASVLIRAWDSGPTLA